MEIEIDVKSPCPVYQQLVDQIKAGVLVGALSAGDALPPIRSLAEALELNPNTVAKAYKQLERDQVIQTARRAGTFVREDASLNCMAANQRKAIHELDLLIGKLQQQGMSKQEIAELLRTKARKMSA